jgi:hypothetical protein
MFTICFFSLHDDDINVEYFIVVIRKSLHNTFLSPTSLTSLKLKKKCSGKIAGAFFHNLLLVVR